MKFCFIQNGAAFGAIMEFDLKMVEIDFNLIEIDINLDNIEFNIMFFCLDFGLRLFIQKFEFLNFFQIFLGVAYHGHVWSAHDCLRFSQGQDYYNSC